MSDATTISYCENRVEIENPKADKTCKQYREGESLRKHLPQIRNPRHTEEKKSGKEAYEAFLLQFQKAKQLMKALQKLS